MAIICKQKIVFDFHHKSQNSCERTSPGNFLFPQNPYPDDYKHLINKYAKLDQPFSNDYQRTAFNIHFNFNL